MPKLNPYLENKKPIELVQELKDEYKMKELAAAVQQYTSKSSIGKKKQRKDCKHKLHLWKMTTHGEKKKMKKANES